MSNPLTDLLAEKDVLLGDGGMGTSLFELGLANGAPGELWNLEHPEKVESVYKGFVDAGSDIILTNTFGANAYRFQLHSAPENVIPVNTAAAELARRAADSVDRPVIVAGSMGPSGEMLVPIGERTIEEVEVAFTEQAQALKDGGADILWIETIFFEDELEAAVRAANNVDIPYVSTMTFDTGGRTMMGLKPEDAVKLPAAQGWAPLAFGANCGVGPAQIIDTILGLASNATEDQILVSKSNCGIPEVNDEMKVVYSGTPQIMADYAVMARDAGARIIGGCCGTTPEHVKAMREALDTTPRGAAPDHAAIEAVLGPVKITVDLSSQRY